MPGQVTPVPVGVYQEPPPEDAPAISGVNIGGSDAAKFAHYVNYELQLASELIRRVQTSVP